MKRFLQSFGVTATLLITAVSAHATIKLEKISILVDQKKGESTLRVDNIGNYSVLLFSSVADNALSQRGKDPLFILSPPVARIDPGKSQLVRIMLNDPAQLDPTRQQMRHLYFQEIPDMGKGDNLLKVNARHRVVAVASPEALKENKTPWRDLVWQPQQDRLQLKNTGPYVVRLVPSIRQLPGNQPLILEQPYLLPGQTITTRQGERLARGTTQIQFTPISSTGRAVPAVVAPLSPR
ncbi:fimbria/pilus periplasmic chaperone [Serratia ficaria]|jgi:P pilus assembly chaperone PapD|uniref:Putative fimbrial chaperone protein n=1 Tax=Serratia ficaria TaxID=61651 RepID=A0A240C9N4_SERFI|nr:MULTISPECIES: fimbria/pilus periplasmic chaperone [Serratia]MEE4484890.1 fimbria/pilus periplasmic chaperone [Serratia ficaria]REF43317.1 P pilus assembly chaperone PapD [Serratia ficaria]CAI0698225.1 putative fimbrial chaperone protein [Serratia ficaria]CAI1065847.1 putative fimbrial chaperone protein [Serratia ficaria]CAI1084248.1 putative fimbrial chaperone protein [Serratia ficaria]